MSANINLYDPALKTRRDLLAPGPALAIVGVTALAMLLAVSWARSSTGRLASIAEHGAAELQARQAAMQVAAEISAARKPDPAVQAAVGDAERTLARRKVALQALAASPVDRESGFAARLEALARQSVDGLWLTGVVVHQDDVVLKGRALQPQLIPIYVQRLDREPSLQGHAFKALEVVRPIDRQARSASVPADAGTVAAPRSVFVEFTLSGGSEKSVAAEGAAPP